MSADTVQRAERLRELILEMAIQARSAHIGSSLSIAVILAVLYFDVLRRDRPRPDRFLLSKGHAASALYAALALSGDLEESEVVSGYCADGGRLAGHPERWVPGVEMTAGSLGHGPAVAIGLALSDRIDGSDRRTFCLVGDGELNEGSVWEAAALAAQLELGSVTMIVDANGLQGFGRTSDVMNLEPFAAKWESFGFRTSEIDGHDLPQIAAALEKPGDGRPHCIVARTTKGKGVRFMENRLEWHYLPMSEAQYLEAIEGLSDAGGVGP